MGRKQDAFLSVFGGVSISTLRCVKRSGHAMSRHTDPPYPPFYPDNIASHRKVESMTTEEIGANTLLPCKAWREDPCAEAFQTTTPCWLGGRDLKMKGIGSGCAAA